MTASLKFAQTLIDRAEYDMVVHREPAGKEDFASFECEDEKGRFFRVTIEQVDEIDDYEDDVDDDDEDIGML